MVEQEEGLNVCPVCGEPLEGWFEVEGLIPKTKRGRKCYCERKADEEEAAEATRKKLALTASKRRMSGLSDDQYRASRFAMDDGRDAHSSRVCKRYVDKWEAMRKGNYGLLLWGEVGGGKTFFAACIANALLEKGVNVMMTTIPNLEAAMNSNYRKERRNVLDKVKEADLLILDDVGVGRMNSTALEASYDIVNERYKAQKPLIITTNLTMIEIKEEKELALKRIYSRLIELCTPVKVQGLQRREEKARQKMEQMRMILEA